MRRRVMLAVSAIALAFATCSLLPHERLTDRVLPTPSRVYARPLVLAAGLQIAPEELTRHLDRVGYQRAKGNVQRGEFRVEKRRIEIGRRPFRFPDGLEPGGLTVVEFDARHRVRAVRNARGEPLDAVFLEPEVVGTLFGDGAEDRVLVTLDQLPDHLVAAVVETEDRRFRWHLGIDPVRIAGAALENWREREVVEGGSTITQQLVKNVYLSPERTLARKLREAAIAVWLELRYSKDEILEAYLNQIYLGQDGGRAIHGVGRASHFYFGRRASEISLAEAALLAGMIRAPNALSPFRNPDRATRRRNQVLGLMRDAGKIDAAAYEAARDVELRVRREERRAGLGGHYVDWVRGRLAERFGDHDLERDGFDVFTALDVSFQRAAERAVKREVARLEKGYPLLRRKASPLQAALVAIDPTTGDVVALVGGRDYVSSPFDRATRALRQPGSVFKPVVALAALTAEDAGQAFTLATILEDRPLEMEVEDGEWAPVNHDRRHRGPVTIRTALEDSLNVPFARLGMEVGLVHVAETARALGVSSPLRPVPSLSLGAFEMTPLEVAGVYSVLASEGVRREARATLAVVEPDGDVRRGDSQRARRVFGADETWVVTDALRGVVDRGTGKSLRALGVTGPVAAKTGTTNDFRDAWFVAYTPDLVVVAWVGFDDGARVGLTGAKAALPIVARFLGSVPASQPLRGFEAPSGVEVVEIDPRTGLRASESCPGEPEVFLRGTAPRRTCRAGDWRRPFRWVRDVLER